MQKRFYLKGSCLAVVFVCSSFAKLPVESALTNFLNNSMRGAAAGSHLVPSFKTTDGIYTYDSLREMGKVATGTLENCHTYFVTLRGTYNHATAAASFDNEIFIAKALELYAKELERRGTLDLESVLNFAYRELTGIISNYQRREKAKSDSRIYLNNTKLLPFVKTLHTLKKKEDEGRAFNARIAQRASFNNILNEANAAFRRLTDINEKRYFLSGFLFGDGSDNAQSLLQKLIASDADALTMIQSVGDLAKSIFGIAADYGNGIIKESEEKDELRLKLAATGFDLLSYLGENVDTNLLANGQSVGQLLRSVAGKGAGEQDMINCLRGKLCELFDCLPDDKFQIAVNNLSQIQQFSDLAFTPASYTTWSNAQLASMRVRQAKPLEDKLRIIEALTDIDNEDYTLQGINGRSVIIRVRIRINNENPDAPPEYNYENQVFTLDADCIALVQSVRYLKDNAGIAAQYEEYKKQTVRDVRTRTKNAQAINRVNQLFPIFERLCSEYFKATSQEGKNAVILKKMELFRQIADIYPKVSELEKYWKQEFGTYFSHQTIKNLYTETGERRKKIKDEIESIKDFSNAGNGQVRLLSIPHHRRNSEIIVKKLMEIYSNVITPSMATDLLPTVAELRTQETTKGRIAMFYPDINNLAGILNEAEIYEDFIYSNIGTTYLTTTQDGKINFQRPQAKEALKGAICLIKMEDNPLAQDNDQDANYDILLEPLLDQIEIAVGKYNRSVRYYGSIPANWNQYLREHSFGPHLDGEAFALLRNFDKDEQALNKLTTRVRNGDYPIGIEDFSDGIIANSNNLATQKIPLGNFVKKFFDPNLKVKKKYASIEGLLTADDLFVGRNNHISSEEIPEPVIVGTFFLNSDVINAFSENHDDNETQNLITEFIAAFSQYRFESVLCNNGEFELVKHQQREEVQRLGAFSWIPELDQASLDRTQTKENLQYKKLDIANIRNGDFLNLQNQISQYTSVYSPRYTFEANSGNLSGVRCDEEGLRNIYQRHYNGNWNKFLQDISNYFAVSRTIGGNTIYSPPSLTQRTDIVKSPKENTVTFLKFLDLAFKKSGGRGGLSLQFGHERINLSNANALEKIVAHRPEAIEEAAKTSISSHFEDITREMAGMETRAETSTQNELARNYQNLANYTSDYRRHHDRIFNDFLDQEFRRVYTGNLNLLTMFQQNTDYSVQLRDYAGHIIEATKCFLNRPTRYGTIIYEPQNFSNINYIFGVFQHLYDTLIAGQNEANAEEIAISFGQCIQSFHHCAAGQTQGIAELLKVAIDNDRWILPNLSARGLLSTLYQGSIESVIDSNLNFVERYDWNDLVRNWVPHSINGEFAMKRANAFNLIKGKFGRNGTPIRYPAIGNVSTELAKHLAVNKRDIWDIIQSARLTMPYSTLTIPSYSDSRSADNGFYRGVNNIYISEEEQFAIAFAKAAITPKAVVEHISALKGDFIQILARKLIQEEGEALFSDKIGEIVALRERIAAREEIRFTKEQLKTIIFKGLSKFGFIQ